MANFIDHVEFNQVEARNLVTHKRATPPASPVQGQRYFDTSLNKEGVYNGTSWDYAGSGAITAIGVDGPITSTGGLTPTIGILPASGSIAGSMSISDFMKLGGSTSANTPSTLVQRDSSGNFAAGTITADLTGTASNAAQLGSQAPAFYQARANHTGTQTAATISDFDAQTRLSRLDQMATPTAAVGFGGQRLTALAPPTNGTDAVNKDFVEALVSTGTNKGTARVASTATVTISSPGAAIDGVALTAGDLVLLKDQAAGQENGLYTWNGAAVAMTRATNADTSAEVKSGMFVFVTEGAVNGDNGFTLVTNDPIVLGTTPLLFSQTSGAGQIIPGAGLSKAGNTLNVEEGYGIFVSGDIAIDTAIVARKFTQTIGDGTATTITVTHGLNNPIPCVSVCLAASPFTKVEPTIAFPTINTASFTFAVAPAANQYRVGLLG
jgi:hypothetical protein